MKKITDVCPFCGEETLSEEGFFTGITDNEVKFCYDFVCENCCEEWTVWETYTLTEKKRWYSKYIEVEENMLTEDKKCTCDECCGGDNCKSQDEKPACETKDANTDAIKVNLEVELDEEKLKKAVDSIVDEAFEKAGKATGTPNSSWDDFFKVWEDLWVDLDKKDDSTKAIGMSDSEIARAFPGLFVTTANKDKNTLRVNAINEVLDDLWRKPAKKINPKGGHPQDK